MRIFSIAVFFIFLGSKLFAQNNLQFNQVKLVGSTSETVPTGKVWKIESAPLTLKNGIRIPPSFVIGNDTIILGYDSYTTFELENVVSVRVDWKGANNGLTSFSSCGSCDSQLPSNGSNSVTLSLEGFSVQNPIISESLSFSNVPNLNSGSYINLGTRNFQASGNNVINNWSISFNPVPTQPCLPNYSNWVWGVNYVFKVIFNLLNGNSISYIVSKNQFGCGNSPGTLSISGPIVGNETKSRPQVTTQFPIWIPAGTPVKTLSNIGKLSILEFNVTQ
jgi:hypothetical protein